MTDNHRATVTQGIPQWWAMAWRRARGAIVAGCLGWGALAAAEPACGLGSVALALRPLAQGVWWVPGLAGDSNATNRGHVTQPLVVSEGRRLWLVGAGATPRHAAALACLVHRELKRPVTDVIVPWAKAEHSLGAPGWPAARLWAHEGTVANMAERCQPCGERLRQRMGNAAIDLTPPGQPVAIRMADHTVRGASGKLGPFAWQRVDRGQTTPVLMVSVTRPTLAPGKAGAQRTFVTAPGIAWHQAAPDLRDSTVPAMQRATRTAASAVQKLNPQAWVVPEQGAVAPALSVLRANLRYWQALDASIAQALRDGSDPLHVPTALPGVLDTDLMASHHALNWQRAWRQAEATWR